MIIRWSLAAWHLRKYIDARYPRGDPRWSTSVLVCFTWLLNHVSYLKRRNKLLLLQAEAWANSQNDNRIILSEKSCHFVDLLSQVKQTSTDVDHLTFFPSFCEQEICKLRKDCANSILKAFWDSVPAQENWENKHRTAVIRNFPPKLKWLFLKC